jgi:hypothetical protein
MKNLTIAIFLTILISLDSFGWSGKLISPQLGLSSDLSDSQIERVHSLINYMTNDLTFIEGSFINQFSSQRFGGTAEKVSCFLKRIRTEDLWKVEVYFSDFEEQETAFSLFQGAQKDTITIFVNSGRHDFLLNHFSEYLPIKGHEVKVPKKSGSNCVLPQ